eukprot:TRINITY_DN24560_c0_g1_i3.p2 TRINITY_DN24560_c0_g1~~TRINITY_DN24560_c0_g1_i3.p2  ORF type:complete len:184 (+),score=41.92 TRINITY_DN24560_c0_g1_i3:135-686(+)
MLTLCMATVLLSRWAEAYALTFECRRYSPRFDVETDFESMLLVLISLALANNAHIVFYTIPPILNGGWWADQHASWGFVLAQYIGIVVLVSIWLIIPERPEQVTTLLRRERYEQQGQGGRGSSSTVDRAEQIGAELLSLVEVPGEMTHVPESQAVGAPPHDEGVKSGADPEHDQESLHAALIV